MLQAALIPLCLKETKGLVPGLYPCPEARGQPAACSAGLLQQCTEDNDSCRLDLRTSNDFFSPFFFFMSTTGLTRMLNAGTKLPQHKIYDYFHNIGLVRDF